MLSVLAAPNICSLTLINEPIKPYSALLVTSHCTLRRKDSLAHLHAGSVLAERVGQEEVGGVTRRVMCTWWLLGLALKRPWLAPGGPPPALTAWTV